ncbi:MAG: ATP-binding protein [Desulfosarcina sp.]|nr:ATP-binding protein [Desulfobacterales bacterium]
MQTFFNTEEINAYAQKYNVNARVIDLAVKKAGETTCGPKNEFHKAARLGLKACQSLINDGQPPVNKERIETSYSLAGLNISDDPDSLMLRLEAFDQHLRSSGQDNISNMNLLFYGPQGAGKSELARYIGKRLDR